ncbi:hypothetical protein IMCC1989_1858 [gamma proteobacterium IMCC1989]|nr:hypothetical protein IMCC1989_1858 [gamma proteobacterium IMCC1989]
MHTPFLLLSIVAWVTEIRLIIAHQYFLLIAIFRHSPQHKIADDGNR